MSRQEYIDHVLNSLPPWFSKSERTYELIKAFAEMFCRAQEQGDFYHSMSFLEEAHNAPPDWLNQHAVDRGLLRQAGETDAALRDRIRGLDDAVNYISVLAAAQAIVDAEGIVGDVGLLELRPNKSFFLTRTNQTGTGGEFTDLNDGEDGFGFEPSVLAEPSAGNTSAESFRLLISGANSAANDGDFEIDGGHLNGFSYDNATGVAEPDAGVSWELYWANSSGANTSGFSDAFFTDHTEPDACGYRMGSQRNTLIVILPFGCTQTTMDAVTELLFNIKGAGVQLIVECRQNP